MSCEPQYEHDKNIWNACAADYERTIVHGHPDVTAYESFEEDFLDRLLLYLMREYNCAIHLYDVGCGSGRLHLRYGLKSLHPDTIPGDAIARSLQNTHKAFQYNPLFASKLKRVGGLDFSSRMLELAETKLRHAGLADSIGDKLYLEQGSAFELQPFPAKPLPVAVNLCNGIGVMQGPEGARKVFQAMRRAVESADGIAVISAYRRERISDFALGNYESTMDVSGPPVWLEPETYASQEYCLRPRTYKRAYDTDIDVVTDVYNTHGAPIRKGVVLKRNPAAVFKTIKSGHIKTHHGYESHWYAFSQFREWILEYWPAEYAWHFPGSSLDKLRAAPAQLAVLDAGNRLGDFFERLEIDGPLE